MPGGVFGGIGEPVGWEFYNPQPYTPLRGASFDNRFDAAFPHLNEPAASFNERFLGDFSGTISSDTAPNFIDGAPLPQSRPPDLGTGANIAGSDNSFVSSSDSGSLNTPSSSSSDSSGSSSGGGFGNFSLPSFGDVFTGMMNGPTGINPLTGKQESAKGVDWGKMLEQVFVFLLGAIFVVGGLFLFAREQGINLPNPVKAIAK